MSKFWALIISNRPHIYSLGQQENVEKAMSFAEEFCDRKTKENEATNENNRRQVVDYNSDNDLPDYQLAYIMDENDLRTLTGEVHRPLVIAHQRKEIEVESPKKHHSCKDGGTPCQCCHEEKND